MDDFLIDDAKLIDVLLRDELAHAAWWVAEQAGVERTTRRRRCAE
jgi:hypothetical protein